MGQASTCASRPAAWCSSTSSRPGASRAGKSSPRSPALPRAPGIEPPLILAINVAEVPGRVRRFLEGTPLDFPVLLDSDRTVTKAWGVYALPTTYVLDRSLAPRLVVEGDLDWTADDVVAALRRVAELATP